jgi:hypothetical protein
MDGLFVAGFLITVGVLLFHVEPQPQSEWDAVLGQPSPEQTPPAKLGCGSLLLLAFALFVLIVGGLLLG